MSYTDKQGREWNDLDTDSLPQAVQGAYNTYREANRVAAQHREAFEKAMMAEMGTEAVQFGYKWGKLSFTTDVEAKKAKASGKAKLTLAEWQEANRHI